MYLTKELGISEHVRFVGLVPHREVAQYLCAADIYVSTSFVDSTSVSLLEAMACGVAPVVTDIYGNREWVENGVNGLLYSPKDPKSLAERIIQLIEDEDQRAQFGDKCVEIIRERAIWEKCVSKMEAIYKELL
jgi:glycosyltransferase involved in cell wall biosynthesis